MTDPTEPAQSTTAPDQQPIQPYPEPPAPPPEVEGVYECVYGIWEGDRYLPPGSLFHALPSHPRVLAKQARLVKEEPTSEQADAISAAVAEAVESE